MSEVDTMDIVRRVIREDRRVDWLGRKILLGRNRDLSKRLQSVSDKAALKAELERQGRELGSHREKVERIFDLLVEVELALVELGAGDGRGHVASGPEGGVVESKSWDPCR